MDVFSLSFKNNRTLWQFSVPIRYTETHGGTRLSEEITKESREAKTCTEVIKSFTSRLFSDQKIANYDKF